MHMYLFIYVVNNELDLTCKMYGIDCRNIIQIIVELYPRPFVKPFDAPHHLTFVRLLTHGYNLHSAV